MASISLLQWNCFENLRFCITTAFQKKSLSPDGAIFEKNVVTYQYSF